MTREQFQNKYKHLVAGIVLDGMQRRDPNERAIWVDQIFKKVESVLNQMHADLEKREPKPSSNGKHEEQRVESSTTDK